MGAQAFLPHLCSICVFTNLLKWQVSFTSTFFFLAAQHGLQDLSSPNRDGTQGPGSESNESYPLDCSGIPHKCILMSPFPPLNIKCVLEGLCVTSKEGDGSTKWG